MEQLFQNNPRYKSTYIPLDKNGNPVKNRSFTDSHESYQNGASKESAIIRWNNRLPTKELVLRLHRIFTSKEIKAIRTKIFRYLKEHGLEAIANIELTTRGMYRTPNNTVHFHILTDDPRSIGELVKLLSTACERNGLVEGEDFSVICKGGFYNADGYIDYFTKYGHSHKVILFQKRWRIQKFYQIGKWFRKSKEELWEDVKSYMREKNRNDSEDNLPTDGSDEFPDEPIFDNCIDYQEIIDQIEYEKEIESEIDAAYNDYRRCTIAEDLRKSEFFIPVECCRAGWEMPTNHAKLKEVLDQRSDQVLYDWFSILLGKPTVFQTKPPLWLLKAIQQAPLKRRDLLDALYRRLLCTRSLEVEVALEHYHNLQIVAGA